MSAPASLGFAALSPEHQQRAADALKLLAHPERLAIVEMLAREGEQTVSRVYAALGLAQGITSQHLTLLKARGLLTSVKSGTSIRYSLVSPALADVAARLLDVVGR